MQHQGDVLSTLLFNAAVEMIMRQWITRLQQHGIKIQSCEQGKRLTHIRYADDLIIYATSLDELTGMVNMINEELKRCGLELNGKKHYIYIGFRTLYEQGSTFISIRRTILCI